jgi:hypothetical protein
MTVMKPIVPYELCQLIDLLVARTIAPNREKLSNHWKNLGVGAIRLDALVRCFHATGLWKFPETCASI